jgi:hypothetical protein
VMLTKGPQVVSLVVYKKGTASKFIKEAKEAGTGVPCFGVIDGRGMDISLKLATADGFKDAPVKDLVLKKFLEEEADFKCKPVIEILESLPLVLDENDPVHARYLKAMKGVDDVAARNPTRGKELKALSAEVGKLLEADPPDQAPAKLAELEKALEGASVPAADDKQAAFQTTQAKLEPLLLKLTKLWPDKAGSWMNLWNYADAQAAAGNYPNAEKALAGLTDALKKGAAEAPQSDARRHGIAENIVADRKKFVAVRWQQTMAGVRSELAKLEQGIARALPGVNAAEITAGVEQSLNEFLGELSDAVTKAGTADGAKPLDQALEVVRRYKQLTAGDENIRLLGMAKSELGVDVDIARTLGDALGELEVKLAG